MKLLHSAGSNGAVFGVYLGALFALGSAAPLEARENPLALAPASSQFVVEIQASEALGSPLVELLIEDKVGKEAAEKKAKAVEALTGVNLLEDIETVHIFGIIDNDASMVFVVTGEYDEQRLVDLLPLQESYAEIEIAGRAVHEMNDGNEPKYGYVAGDGQIVIAASKKAMTASLAALDEKGASFLGTNDSKLFNTNLGATTAWVAVGALDTDSDLGGVAQVVGAKAALITSKLGAKTSQFSALLLPDSADDLPAWYDFVKGAAALGTIQRADPTVRRIAERVEVGVDKSAGAVQVDLQLGNEEVIDILHELHNR